VACCRWCFSFLTLYWLFPCRTIIICNYVWYSRFSEFHSNNTIFWCNSYYMKRKKMCSMNNLNANFTTLKMISNVMQSCVWSLYFSWILPWMTLLGLGLRCMVTHAGCMFTISSNLETTENSQVDWLHFYYSNWHEGILETFVGARGYLGRRCKKCTGKSSTRLIRWQRHLQRFMFLFAARFLNEKFMQSTHVNLVFCAVWETFFIADFMPEVLVFSSPRIIKKICIHP